MGVLRYPKREQFAHEIVAGKSATEAYRLVGFKGDRRGASKLRHSGDILRRVDELLAGKASIYKGSHALAVREAAV